MSRGGRHQGQLLPSLREQGRGRPGGGGVLEREHVGAVRHSGLEPGGRSARTPAGVHRFPRTAGAGRNSRFHLSARNAGAGGLPFPPALARAAGEGIERHLDTLVATIEEAKRLHAPDDDWASRDLARYIQAVLQGGFVLAKAGGGEQVARECVRQLRRHIENLLPARRRRRGSGTATGGRT